MMGNQLRMLVLSLTGSCNLACRYCYAANLGKKNMSWEVACKAVNLAAALAQGPFILQFSGGEPLLAFDLLEAVAHYVHNQKIPAIMQVQTNGVLLDENMARVLVAQKVGVGVSLDGRPAINDYVRPTAAGNGCTSAVAYRVAEGARYGLEVGMTCVVGQHNVQRLSDIIDMAYYIGNVKRIGFDLLRKQGRADAMFPADAGSVRKGIWKALQHAQHMEQLTRKKIVFSQLQAVARRAAAGQPKMGHCHAITGEELFVDPYGNIFPCPSLLEAQFLLGDVKSGIHRDKWQQITKYCREAMQFCQECPDLLLCGGGCFARWLLAGSGRCVPHEPECSLKRTFAKWFSEEANQSMN